MSQLKAIKLHKSFKSRKVVNGVSLSINSGEIVGLLGPNGAGKTTSFYMIVGLLSADSGNIYIDDIEVTKFAMHERARHGIGYLPQEASVFRRLTVKQNIIAILELRKDLNKKQRLEKTQALLEEFHITHIQDSLGQSLSGGERRRLEIARALAMEPNFILLDEPFAGVDPISVVDIKGIISQLSKKDIGVLITDHNVRETLDICERAYIVNAGEILSTGTPHEILSNEQVRDVYLGKEFAL